MRMIGMMGMNKKVVAAIKTMPIMKKKKKSIFHIPSLKKGMKKQFIKIKYINIIV